MEKKKIVKALQRLGEKTLVGLGCILIIAGIVGCIFEWHAFTQSLDLKNFVFAGCSGLVAVMGIGLILIPSDQAEQPNRSD